MPEIICAGCKRLVTVPVRYDRPRTYCSRACMQANDFHGLRMRSLEDRFWAKVDKDCPHGCWLWTGCVTDRGIGHIGGGRRSTGLLGVHRVSWTIHHGDPGPLHVLHKCDTFYPNGDITYRRCVNPEHLFLGTHDDNMQDMANKGRNRKVVTAEQAIEMRRLHASGEAGAYILAQRFKVSVTTVYSILQRKTFRNV